MKNLQQDVNLLFYQIESRIGSLVEHNKMAATSSSRLRRETPFVTLACQQHVSACSCIFVSCLIPHAKTIHDTGPGPPCNLQTTMLFFPCPPPILLFRIRNVNKP